MEKRISFFEFQSVKSVAKAIEPKLREQAKIKNQIERLAEDYKKAQSEINAYEKGVVDLYGFHVAELVKKVVEVSTDKNGKEVKTAKYMPTDIVTYDNVTKEFIISVPDGESPEPQETPEVPEQEDAPAEEEQPEPEEAEEKQEEEFPF